MNFHDGSNTIRIPISLKFELNEDFYENFINQLRKERRLSDMIINLLRAYYEDAEIRRSVDCRVLGQEEIDALNREIERISFEHSKSVMKTSALKFETDSYFDTVDFVQDDAETPVATMENLLQMVTGLKKEVKQIKETVGLQDAGFNVPDFEAEVAREESKPKTYYNNVASDEDAAIYDDIDDTPEPPFTALQPEKPVSKASEPTFTALNEENINTQELKASESTPAPVKKKVPKSFATLSMTLEG